MKRYIIFIILIISFSFCNEKKGVDKKSESKSTVSFMGREINLKSHLEGFPYNVLNFYPSYASGKAFYLREDTITQLMEVDLMSNKELSEGKIISEIDFSKRNAFKFQYNEQDDLLYWLGDERNDEEFNLYRLNRNTQEITKITDVPYIYGFTFNKEKSKIAYIARLGLKNVGVSEVRILNIEDLSEEVIISDQEEMRCTFGDPSFQPDGKGLVVMANKNSNRAFGNLVYVNLVEKTQTILLDQNTSRSLLNFTVPTFFREWLSEDEFLYMSNEDGFFNVYCYNLREMKNLQVTHFTSDIGTAGLVSLDGQKRIFVTTSSPIETKLYLIDPYSGEVLSEQKSDMMYSVKDVERNKLLVSAVSNSSLFRIDEMIISENRYNTKTLFDVPEELREKIYTAVPKQMSYPTFDVDPATGKQREIHAYLYEPKKPLPPQDRIVMIQSFYGGLNMFSTEYQIYADAGFYVFSPSPRGSFFLGKDFMALNDGDLGGNEIIDIIYAAKFISKKLNVPPDHIGVFGMSHGGYATMRALTFPGKINEIKADFDWGFGIATAGFSDIIHFYNHSNIPDWVTLEAGNPETEAEKLKDRSPLYHADKASGALLLIHGSNDQRVPVEGSRMMADSLKKYDKEFKFIELEGQGHGVKGLENNVFYYQSVFNFIEKVTK